MMKSLKEIRDEVLFEIGCKDWQVNRMILKAIELTYQKMLGKEEG